MSQIADNVSLTGGHDMQTLKPYIVLFVLVSCFFWSAAAVRPDTQTDRDHCRRVLACLLQCEVGFKMGVWKPLAAMFTNYTLKLFFHSKDETFSLF